LDTDDIVIPSGAVDREASRQAPSRAHHDCGVAHCLPYIAWCRSYDLDRSLVKNRRWPAVCLRNAFEMALDNAQ